MKSILLFLVVFSVQEIYSYETPVLKSPCPNLFKYDNKTLTKDDDRWYGTVTLLSDFELNGVWLRLVFDKPSIQLGTWFGEIVSSKDHAEYLLKSPQKKLLANTPHELRFFVRFNKGEAPPQLVSYRLNAKTVCPEGASTEPPVSTPASTDGELVTSDELLLPRKSDKTGA